MAHGQYTSGNDDSFPPSTPVYDSGESCFREITATITLKHAGMGGSGGSVPWGTSAGSVPQAPPPGPKITQKMEVEYKKYCLDKDVGSSVTITTTFREKKGGVVQPESSSTSQPPTSKVCEALDEVNEDGNITLENVQKIIPALFEAGDTLEPKVSDIMKKLCEESKNLLANDKIISYKIKVVCIKKVGPCNATCDGTHQVTIITPIGASNIDLSGGQTYNYDPCKMSELLDCWKKKEKPDVTINGANVWNDNDFVTIIEAGSEGGNLWVDILLKFCKEAKDKKK